MFSFFNDIEDIASCLDFYSLTDFAVNSVPYSYAVRCYLLTYIGSTIHLSVRGGELFAEIDGYHRV
jgi:hypothetical protein